MHCLLALLTNDLCIVHASLIVCWLVRLRLACCCLLRGPVTVVVPALLGVVRSVCAHMFLAERAMLLCPVLLGLLGVA